MEHHESGADMRGVPQTDKLTLSYFETRELKNRKVV